MSAALSAQINRLVALGIHEKMGLPAEDLRQALGQLQIHLPRSPDVPDAEIRGDANMDAGTAEAVIVINTPALPARQLLPLVSRNGKPAMERLHPRQPEDFRPTSDIALPVGEAYLLLGVDRGNATLNAVPSDAQKRLEAQQRLPLTVEEGICLLLQWPQFLQPNRCFMMLGSRCGDRRVPALWLSNQHPRLGWCWEGNPHTWLGFASCMGRSPGVALRLVSAASQRMAGLPNAQGAT